MVTAQQEGLESPHLDVRGTQRDECQQQLEEPSWKGSVLSRVLLPMDTFASDFCVKTVFFPLKGHVS